MRNGKKPKTAYVYVAIHGWTQQTDEGGESEETDMIGIFAKMNVRRFAAFAKKTLNASRVQCARPKPTAWVFRNPAPSEEPDTDAEGPSAFVCVVRQPLL